MSGPELAWILAAFDGVFLAASLGFMTTAVRSAYREKLEWEELLVGFLVMAIVNLVIGAIVWGAVDSIAHAHG